MVVSEVPLDVASLRKLIVNELKRPEAASTFQLTLSRTAVQKLKEVKGIPANLKDISRRGRNLFIECDPNNLDFRDTYQLNPPALLGQPFLEKLTTLWDEEDIGLVILPSAAPAGLFSSHLNSQFLF